MKKLFLILCLSAATINAMDGELQALNPVQKVQKLVTDLKHVSAQLDSLTQPGDIPAAQMQKTLAQSNKKFKELQTQLTQFKSSFSSKNAVADGTLNLGDIETMLNSIMHAELLCTDYPITSLVILQKIDKQAQEEKKKKVGYYQNLQTVCYATAGIGCLFIVKGICDALPK